MLALSGSRFAAAVPVCKGTMRSPPCKGGDASDSERGGRSHNLLPQSPVWDNSRTLRRVSTVVCLLLAFTAWIPAIQAQQASPLFGVIGITREVAPVEERLEGATVTRIQGMVFTSGTIAGARIVTVRSGAGKTNAAIAATLLVDRFMPSAVIFTGTAGAIDPELNPGDVVIGTAVGYHDFGSVAAAGFVRSPTRNPASGQSDPAFFPADPKLLSAARRAAASTKAATRFREGLIVTGDAFISNPAHRDELRNELKASAVEMEGAAVAQVCARFGVPMLVIRSITDRADGSASGSYTRFVETASRNAADLAIATIQQFLK
jgi:adenosylhomocysteine nucleosidase